jgi:hypothetical protein
VDNKKIKRAIEYLGEELAKVYEIDPDWTRRFKAGDDSAIDEIVWKACERAGATTEEYEEALATDSSLQALQKQTIVDTILAPLNPGPGNPQYRESTGAREVTTILEDKPWWKFW